MKEEAERTAIDTVNTPQSGQWLEGSMKTTFTMQQLCWGII